MRRSFSILTDEGEGLEFDVTTDGDEVVMTYRQLVTNSDKEKGTIIMAREPAELATLLEDAAAFVRRQAGRV